MNPNGDKRRPAVFLDRDGTLIEDRGDLSQASQVVFFPQAVEALRRLQEHFDLFIVTNQSGVAKGTLTPRDVARVNEHVASHLAASGVRLVATYVCPHQRDDRCRCIKPKPFFLREAERQHGVDLARSFVVGDHPHDVALADSVGAQGLYLLTGHGVKHRPELPDGVVIVADIAAAADWILERVTPQKSDGS